MERLDEIANNLSSLAKVIEELQKSSHKSQQCMREIKADIEHLKENVRVSQENVDGVQIKVQHDLDNLRQEVLQKGVKSQLIDLREVDNMPPIANAMPPIVNAMPSIADVAPPNVDVDLSIANGVPPMENAVLKLYDLPEFSGKPGEWPLFYASFRDTTACFNYSNRHNLMRLQRSLSGVAKEAVTSMLIYPNDVPNAIKELEFRFGRPDLLMRSQLDKIQQFPTISESKIDNIIAFSTLVRNVVAFLKSAKAEHHLLSTSLLEQLVSKLPHSKQFEWAAHAVDIEPYATALHFSEWLGKIAKVVCLMPQANNVATKPSPPLPPKRVMHVNNDERTGKCLFCDGDHLLINCDGFLNECDVQKRWEKAKEWRVCFACLNKGHDVKSCRSKKHCNIDGCRRFHNEILHNSSLERSQSTTGGESEEPVRQVLSCLDGAGGCLFKIVPVTIFGPNGKADIYALLDEGASISILDDKIAQQLGLKGRSVPLTMQWYGGKPVTEQSTYVNFEIAGTGGVKYAIKKARAIAGLDLPVQSLAVHKFKHFQDLPLHSYTKAKPLLLLGLDSAHLITYSKIVAASKMEPIAIETKLGWLAYGPNGVSAVTPTQLLFVAEQNRENELYDCVAAYFATEKFGTEFTTTNVESEDDKKARMILQSTIRRIKNSFEVGLLWKEFPPSLPNDWSMAVDRLKGIERKCERSSEFGAKYSDEVKKYVDKGYARKLSLEEIEEHKGPTWFLPHFAVYNPHKPQKLRIVFDAAATFDGRSLNSALLKGPEQSKPLLSVLLKFRQGSVAVAADIREMFSQIQIRPEDQHVQRFIWRDADSNQPAQQYMMTSLIFGAVCSPCIAEYVKNHNADDYKDQYPEAVDAIHNNFYVDDFVCSFNDAQEAVKICRQVISINAHAGFELRDFKSNSQTVQLAINNGEAANICDVSLDCQAVADKVLGMYWNTASDTFQFHTKFVRVAEEVMLCKRPPTKREFLGLAMSVFDPFGMLADFLLALKIILQETWKLGLDWDEPLPPRLAEAWFAWWKEFEQVQTFAIGRCYSPHFVCAESIELHVFMDASEIAFSAVAYWRITYNDVIHVAFVAGKTRVAPQKLMSIPRLELQAAVLATRLHSSIINNHDIKVDRVWFWSDSRTVLCWVNSAERKYKPFVGHRIAEILNFTRPEQWRWVPTKQNPADAATRVPTIPKFASMGLWLSGPDFLRLSDDHWPEMSTVTHKETTEEIKPCHIIVQASENLINFYSFNSFLKLKRAVAWMLRSVRAFLNKLPSHWVPTLHQSYLSVKEIETAEMFIIKIVQREHFSTEIAALEKHINVDKKSSIYKFAPYVDNDGIVRASGRIDEATYLPLSVRRPILLPKSHRISQLIIMYTHERLHHQNAAVVLNEVRQKYWILGAKVMLKSIINECPRCQLTRAKPSIPQMGQLPIDRVAPKVRAFTYAGVDLFGPLTVTIGRRHEKRWGVLFTCLTYRAVHLELAEDLSTDAFLRCLRNFINRRGTPIRLRSDNGTNFVGAQKEKKASERLLNTDRLEEEAVKFNIEWVFNCPLNPSSGGCWERLIRIVKRILKATLNEEAPKVETLRSVLIEAENIVNSRPLTEVPLSNSEDEPLTPNHFLIGCANATQTPAPDDMFICPRKQWHIAQNLKDRLWKQWTVQYLPQLIHRPKWHVKVEPLKIDDIVLICDVALPRGQWLKGRIVKTFPAKDGQMRFVEVKTKSGVLRRPVNKLALLTVCGESPIDSREVGC